MSASGGPGRIVLAATPIGNAGDASARLVELLATADIVAAEDTRRLHRLVQNLGVTVAGRIISYHEHNEAAKTADLLAQVRSGKTLVMVTDAGMPSVSDPGFRLVEGAVAAGLTVTAGAGTLRRADRPGAVRACRRTGSASRASCRARPVNVPRGWRISTPSGAPWCFSRHRTGWSPC